MSRVVTGPKLFVKPSSKSNRHIIVNALSYCCLAGIVNTDLKNKVLEVSRVTRNALWERHVVNISVGSGDLNVAREKKHFECHFIRVVFSYS